VLIATFFTNLTTYGTDQSMVQRYLTTASPKAARKSVMTNAILTIPATLIFFLIGTLLFVYYKTNPAQNTLTLDSNDAIFPWYIYTQLPVGMVGLLIAGIFAAAMSTLSGSMNSVATAYVMDIRPKLFKIKSVADLKVARRATLIAGALSLLFAFFMATWNINSLWDEFNRLLGLILGSMGGLFLLGMVTKKANAPGALIGIVVSVAVQLIVANYTPVHLLLYTTVGFITCFAIGYLASYFFKTNKIIV
jgi:Na+/proline symporter